MKQESWENLLNIIVLFEKIRVLYKLSRGNRLKT